MVLTCHILKIRSSPQNLTHFQIEDWTVCESSLLFEAKFTGGGYFQTWLFTKVFFRGHCINKLVLLNETWHRQGNKTKWFSIKDNKFCSS